MNGRLLSWYSATVVVVFVLGAFLGPLGLLVLLGIGAAAVAYRVYGKSIYERNTVMSNDSKKESKLAEKQDKLAQAMGLEWRIIPEIRRWFRKTDPQSDVKSEQPQLIDTDKAAPVPE